MDDKFTNSIFEEAWWLDMVAPGQWGEITVKKDGLITGRLPYFLKKNGPFEYLTMPPLTPYLGPWIRMPVGEIKTSTRIAYTFEILCQMIELLPTDTLVAQSLHWSCANHLPFFWAGFEQTTHYTYLLHLQRCEKEIWAGLDWERRGNIRKARQLVRIRDAPDHVPLWNVLRSTYARQGTSPSVSESLLQRLVAAGAERGRGRIMLAEDENGRVHAAGFFVWDGNTIHYLIGGGDADLRSSGAGSLIIWEGIRLGLKVGCSLFDFEGSNIRKIERFFRSFGGAPQPYSTLRKTPLWLDCVRWAQRHALPSVVRKAPQA
jgi:hypothetical protein